MNARHKKLLIFILATIIIIFLVSLLPTPTYIIEYYDENMVIKSEIFDNLEDFNQRCKELDSIVIYTTVI